MMGNIFARFRVKQTKEIKFQDLVGILQSKQYVVALTGAGVSAESEIPTFRDPGDGLWTKYDPQVYATIWGFWSHPEKIWELLHDFLMENDPLPNDSHKALAHLESQNYLKCIITQNVDNLHQDAGSKNVIEYHGNFMKATCQSCGSKIPLSKKFLRNLDSFPSLPPQCNCGGHYKPDVILFGESIPKNALNAATAEVKKCDLLLIIGTSATVSPASTLPYAAMQNGATIVEINIEKTSLTNRVSDYIIFSKSSGLMSTVACLQDA